MRVTAIINCCNEGLLLKRSIDSAFRSIEDSGFAAECELIVAADSANRATMRVLAEYGSRLSQVIQTDHNDLGLARNSGAEIAHGELILFLDGDDLWCRNWIGAAWSEYLISPLMSILHPQYSVFFGSRLELLIHPDWRDPYFDPRGLAARNHWTSLCGIQRDLLVEYPFPRSDAQKRLGFEDWSWYADTIARGFRHVTVPRTTHFIRLKAGESMQKSMQGFCRVPSLHFAEYIAADDLTRPHDL